MHRVITMQCTPVPDGQTDGRTNIVAINTVTIGSNERFAR